MEYFKSTLEILSEAIHSINMEEFNQLVDESIDTLKNNRKIIVSGLGKNVPICDKFVGTMVSLGLDASFLHTNSAIHGDMGIIKDGDLVILLTKSGETAESIYLTQKLEGRNLNLWLFSFERDSTLYKKIEKHLIVKLQHEGDMWNIVPNNSTTINLIVLQALAMNIAKKLGVTIDEFRKNHPGGFIGETLKEH